MSAQGERPAASLGRSGARALDARAIGELGLPGVVLMENAGRGACEALLPLLADERPVLLLAGGGNNGGDAWVVARRLHVLGRRAEVLALRAPESLRGDARVMAAAAVRMGVAFRTVEADAPTDLHVAHRSYGAIVDGVLGTGARGAPRGAARTLLEGLDCARGFDLPPVLALDLPSGLDADTGEVPGAVLRADLTVTFAAPKRGFAQADPAVLGRVVVCDIGVPLTW